MIHFSRVGVIGANPVSAAVESHPRHIMIGKGDSRYCGS